MKTKAKLILAMSVLTAGVVAAGATGTFAWFTTNRAAQLNYTSVIAQKNAGNLDVYMGEGTGASSFNEGTKAKTDKNHPIAYVEKSAATNNAKISDVSSGDGLKFVKPIWQTVAGNGQTATNYQPGVWGTDYTTFWFKVTNTGTNDLNVYLNKATAISASTKGNKADDAAAKVARVAINAATKSTSGDFPAIPTSATKTWILENSSTVNQKYLPSTLTADNKADPVAITPTENLQTFVFADGSGLSAIDSTNHPKEQMLVQSLAKETSAYFVVSVWLEGTKEDGTPFDDAAGGSINVFLDLAGTEVFPAA